MSETFAGKRVTILGLGRFGGGVGAARWLAKQGARVTVSDLAPAEQLAQSIAELEDVEVALHVGGHRDADFDEADLIVVNPAVPPRAPGLRRARERGVALTTEINLFVERCAARVVGVTGSVGKSTVSAMIGHILTGAAGEARVHVGGNLGRSLLDALDVIGADDLVVLELSSFQLERTPLAKWSPHVAVITNLSPNHLDWHGSFEAYARSKTNIFAFQNPARDHLILGRDDALRDAVGAAAPEGLARSREFAVERGAATLRGAHGAAQESARWSNLQLQQPGEHNKLNAAAALGVARVLGVADDLALERLASYGGLPHRLQAIADRDGVRYFDDSKATTPEATLTALAAFSEPVVLILGGYDKGSDLRTLAKQAARRCRFVACLGQTGTQLAGWITDEGGRAAQFETLAEVVRACRAAAEPGDVVLLSPACASWGMFVDYRARGTAFARLVDAL